MCDGITHLYTQEHWQVSFINDPQRFFHALPIVAPFGTVILFDGNRPAREFRQFLGEYAPKKRIEYLTHNKVWTEQIQFTESFAKDFEEFQFNNHKKARFDHLAGFSVSKRMLFWFHDAFSGGELAIARSVSKARLQHFCLELGPHYLRQKPIC